MSKFIFSHRHIESPAADVLIPLIRAAATVGFAVAPCSLGFVIIAVSEQIIRSIMVGEDPEILVSSLQSQFPDAAIQPTEQALGLVGDVVSSIERSRTMQESVSQAAVISLSYSCATVLGLRTLETECIPGTLSFPSITTSFGQSTKVRCSPSCIP